MTSSGPRRTALLLAALLLVLTGCGGKDDDDRGDGGASGPQAPAAVIAPKGPKRCLPPGKHLYFQLVRVREPVWISYLTSGVRQGDLAKPRGVEALRMWVKPKPRRFKATAGTRPWPYGMGRTVSRMTGWEDSWDPLPLPDEKPRYVSQGWNYVFVLVEGQHAARADIRIGWQTKDHREGEIALGRGVWFNKRCG